MHVEAPAICRALHTAGEDGRGIETGLNRCGYQPRFASLCDADNSNNKVWERFRDWKVHDFFGNNIHISHTSLNCIREFLETFARVTNRTKFLWYTYLWNRESKDFISVKRSPPMCVGGFFCCLCSISSQLSHIKHVTRHFLMRLRMFSAKLGVVPQKSKIFFKKTQKKWISAWKVRMFYVGPVLLRGKNGILQRSYVSGKIDDSMYFVRRYTDGKVGWTQ